jgi:PilZ domain
MLIEAAERTERKLVALALRDPGFAALLQAVLELWGYQVIEEAAGAGLLLTEGEGPAPAGVTLVRLGGPDRDGLELPLDLARLWALLEQRFHQPQRQHIRIPLQLEVGLVARHRYSEARLESLSDMGGRLLYARELVRGEGVLLRLPLEERMFELDGRVIYCFPRGDGSQFEFGMVFAAVGDEVRRVLRRFIVRTLLETAGARTGLGAAAEWGFFRPE